MVIVANHPIDMSFWSIPNAFASVFIPIFLYLLFRSREWSCYSSPILRIMVLGTIILTHTITALCMTILLFITWGALSIYRDYHSRADNHVSLLVPIGFMIAMFSWWTYASSTSIGNLADLIKWGFSIDLFLKSPDEFRNYAAVIPLGEQLFNNIGMFLFFAFSFIGIFYMVSRRGSGSSFAMAWMGVAPLAIGFFSLISGHSVIENRWWYFAQILLSIPLAVAIYTVGTWKSKIPLHLCSCIIGFVVALSFLMIMSPPANVDNPLFSPNSLMRYSLTEAELETITTLTDKWDGPIETDAYFVNCLDLQYPQISTFCQHLYSDDYLDLGDRILVVREVIVGRPFKIFSSIYKLDYDLNVKLDGLGFSRIYDSNAGSCYRLVE